MNTVKGEGRRTHTHKSAAVAANLLTRHGRNVKVLIQLIPRVVRQQGDQRRLLDWCSEVATARLVHPAVHALGKGITSVIQNVSCQSVAMTQHQSSPAAWTHWLLTLCTQQQSMTNRVLSRAYPQSVYVMVPPMILLNPTVTPWCHRFFKPFTVCT